MSASPGRAKNERHDAVQPRWLSQEEQTAWRGLLRMNAYLTSTLNRQLSSVGLSLQDYGVLVSLSESPHGRRRPYELGESLGLEKTRLSHHLTRLAKRGLVTRHRCPTDQRGWLISITPAGRTALAAAAPEHVAAVRAAFVDQLTTSQLRALTSIATTVLGQIPARAG